MKKFVEFLKNDKGNSIGLGIIIAVFWALVWGAFSLFKLWHGTSWLLIVGGIINFVIWPICLYFFIREFLGDFGRFKQVNYPKGC